MGGSTNQINKSDILVNKKYYFRTSQSLTLGPLSGSNTYRVDQSVSGLIAEEKYIFELNIINNSNKIKYSDFLSMGLYLKKIIIYRTDTANSEPNNTEANNTELEFVDNKITINDFEIKINPKKMTELKAYEIELPHLHKDNSFKSPTFKIDFTLKFKGEDDDDENRFFMGVVFENLIQYKLNQMYEYNQINEMVKKLMNNRDKLLEQNSKNQTIIRARELIKKKIEFHKYWINILYEIIFYTHLVLVVIVILMLLYKLL